MTVSWVATASAKIIESTARRCRPSRIPVCWITLLTAQLTWCGPLRLRQVAPTHKRRCVKPRVIHRCADRHFSTDTGPDRLSCPVRKVIQRLLDHDRGHLRGRSADRCVDVKRSIRVSVLCSDASLPIALGLWLTVHLLHVGCAGCARASRTRSTSRTLASPFGG